MSNRFALPALIAVIAFWPAACSSGGTATSSPTPSRNEAQQALTIGKRFAQCGRDHGHPAFPDPVIVGGKVRFRLPGTGEAAKREIGAVEKIPECQAIAAQLSTLNHRGRPTARATDIQLLRRFAQCVRQHGVPQWPDPSSDGTFRTRGTELEGQEKSPRLKAAFDRCAQFDPGNFGFS